MIAEEFEKWAREYVHKSTNISKREYGNDAYTAGDKNGRKRTLE